MLWIFPQHSFITDHLLVDKVIKMERRKQSKKMRRPKPVITEDITKRDIVDRIAYFSIQKDREGLKDLVSAVVEYLEGKGLGRDESMEKIDFWSCIADRYVVFCELGYLGYDSFPAACMEASLYQSTTPDPEDFPIRTFFRETMEYLGVEK